MCGRHEIPVNSQISFSHSQSVFTPCMYYIMSNSFFLGMFKFYCSFLQVLLLATPTNSGNIEKIAKGGLAVKNGILSSGKSLNLVIHTCISQTMSGISEKWFIS